MANTSDNRDVLTGKQVAARLQLSDATVRKLARAGAIPSTKFGKQLRFYWPAVAEWMSTGRIAPTAPPNPIAKPANR